MGGKANVSDIDRLLEDIHARYVEKHADSYVRDLEQALGIKVDLGCHKNEYVHEAEYDFSIEARNMKNRILEFEQRQTLFSVEECSREFCKLRVVFKFHPENAS